MCVCVCGEMMMACPSQYSQWKNPCDANIDTKTSDANVGWGMTPLSKKFFLYKKSCPGEEEEEVTLPQSLGVVLSSLATLILIYYQRFCYLLLRCDQVAVNWKASIFCQNKPKKKKKVRRSLNRVCSCFPGSSFLHQDGGFFPCKENKSKILLYILSLPLSQ